MTAIVPDLKCECAFATAPLAVTPTYVDVSAYAVRALSSQRGRSYERGTVDAGKGKQTLKNTDRRFDPTYASSPYAPNVLPLRKFRRKLTYAATTYPLDVMYVEEWAPHWEMPGWADVTTPLVDAFDFLSTYSLQTARATATTALSGTNNDLVFTAIDPGGNGNLIAIQYVTSVQGPSVVPRDGEPTDVFLARLATDMQAVIAQAAASRLSAAQLSHANPHHPAPPDSGSPDTVGETGQAGQELSVYISSSVVTVILAQDSTGQILSSANDVAAAVNNTGGLITAANAPGNDGTGLVAAMSPVTLAGGTFARELTGTRINNILDLVGWPAADRAIDAGIGFIMAQGFDATDNQTALQSIQDAEAAELGFFFIDRAGIATFHDRHHRLQGAYLTSQATFGDSKAAGELAYTGVEPTVDRTRIFNEIRVTRPNGVTQIALDVTSQAQYGPRVLTLSPLYATDSESADLATELLRRYKDPLLRFDSVTIVPVRSATLYAQALGRELSDRITVNRRPPGGGTMLSAQVHIEGVKHDATPGMWTTEWLLSPASTDVLYKAGAATAGTAKVVF